MGPAISNTTIIARFRKWLRLCWSPFVLRLCWSPFVIPQGYEPTRPRPSATDPDIGMTDVTGQEGDSLRGFSPSGSGCVTPHPHLVRGEGPPAPVYRGPGATHLIGRR